MSNKVNPPIGFITSADLTTRAGIETFKKQFATFAHQLWLRTGGGSDDVAGGQTRELFPWNQGSSQNVEASVQALFSGFSAGNELYYSDQSANYTATDFEFINASSGITVTLPQYPAENSVVYVRNSDGSTITVDGNGKNINFLTSIRSKLKGTLIEARYLPDSDEWAI